MKKIIPTLCIAVFVSLGVCDHAHAYYATEKNVYAISDTETLYVLQYRFGSSVHGFELPIRVTEEELDKSTLALRYRLEDRDGQVVDTVQATGLVVSNATVREGVYVLPRNKVRTFTFVLGIEHEAGSRPEALQVTALPFTLIAKNGELFANGLTAGELKKYRVE